MDIKYKKGHHLQQDEVCKLCSCPTKQSIMAATTFEIPQSPSSQLTTVLHYLDLVKVFDTDEITKLFTDDFVQSTFPASLNVPPRSKQEDLDFLRGFSERLEGRRLQVRLRSLK